MMVPHALFDEGELISKLKEEQRKKERKRISSLSDGIIGIL